MVSTTLLLLLTSFFASFASAKPVLIGFRTVCEAEYKAIKEEGSLFWDPDHKSAKWAGQLGIGKSLSNVAGLWSGAIAGNVGGDYFTYTTAEDSRIQSLLKIWINPIAQPAQGQDSYPYDEATIQSVLKRADAPEPDQTLRLGVVGDGEELLIPAAVLPGPNDKNTDNKGGLLKLKTHCFKTIKDMQKHMKDNGIPMEANYDSAVFTSKRYKVVNQNTKQAIIDKRESEVVPGPKRLLRFMPRDLKTSKTARVNGMQGTRASGSSFSDKLVLARGYTITLKKNMKAFAFPAPKRNACPLDQTLGRNPSSGATNLPQTPRTDNLQQQRQQ